jgi:hypothetical protein
VSNKSKGMICLISAIALALCVVVPAFARDDSNHGCAEQQLAISAIHWTAGVAGSWFLTVAPSGAAEVSTGDKKHRFQLSANVCADLAPLVEQQGILGLKSAYGVGVIDGEMRKLTVSVGDRRQSMILYSDLASESNRDALKRVLRVWIAVRGLFDIPDAADSRKEDRTLLER